MRIFSEICALTVAAALLAIPAKAGDGKGNDKKNKAGDSQRMSAGDDAKAAKNGGRLKKNSSADKKDGAAAQSIVDKRETRQDKRIQQGVKKGSLTGDEVKTLETQQKAIADLEDSLKSDGNLSSSDFKQLRDSLNTASRCIWAEKHDTDGKQAPAARLGKDVFAKDELTSKLGDPNLSQAEAISILGDFHKTVELKKSLASDDLSDAERAKSQAEYDSLLNKYFQQK